MPSDVRHHVDRVSPPARILTAILSGVLLVAAVSVSMPADVLGSTTMAAVCDFANVRTSASTSATIKARIKAGTTMTMVATVSGGSWKTTCAGKTVSGSHWYKISTVNGKKVSSLYGVSYVYGATGLFKAVTSPSPTPTTSATIMAALCDYVNLRTSASTSAVIRARIKASATVTVAGKVSGSSWKTPCVGKTVSGSSWYKIRAVNGKSVSSLYGVSYLYGATGVFKAVSTQATPTSEPALTEGIDVSVWQGRIDWARVAAAGKRFAIIRASAGSLTVDAAYAVNRARANAAGLYVGAYHIANPDSAPNDALREANLFLRVAKPRKGEIIPALDLEVSNGLSTTALQRWVTTWLERVTAVVGVKPMIYTSPSFWKTHMGDTASYANRGYRILWMAHWGVKQPTVAARNRGGGSWRFWQYTSGGTVPGIRGRVDLDRYKGTDFTKVLIK